DTRSNAPAVVFGITNIYHIWFNGTNFYVLSDQDNTTPGANGGAVVLSNAPSIYAPIIPNATAGRIALIDAQGHLSNSALLNDTSIIPTNPAFAGEIPYLSPGALGFNYVSTFLFDGVTQHVSRLQVTTYTTNGSSDATSGAVNNGCPVTN